MDSGRLEAFSDGVFAVAITLLALGLVISGPSSVSLATKLAAIWPAFPAYAVSFATIGIVWVNHHVLFKNFSEIDRTLLFVNLLMLFFVVSIPFATSTISAYLREGGASASLAAAIYEGVSISFALLLWRAIRHEHLKVALTAEQARRATVQFGMATSATSRPSAWRSSARPRRWRSAACWPSTASSSRPRRATSPHRGRTCWRGSRRVFARRETRLTCGDYADTPPRP